MLIVAQILAGIMERSRHPYTVTTTAISSSVLRAAEETTETTKSSIPFEKLSTA
ncbi:hypothetical protein QCA50_013810 [Cerrena zonata]|uniref:Uncharacterized protein n=1 Tax=Cerrena zonata TaxID=2478898 RepID=A0AAW0FSR3_9APHY